MSEPTHLPTPEEWEAFHEADRLAADQDAENLAILAGAMSPRLAHVAEHYRPEPHTARPTLRLRARDLLKGARRERHR